MNFLIALMKGLHMSIGIHTPPPEQERVYVFMWIGIILFFVVAMSLMFYLMR